MSVVWWYGDGMPSPERTDLWVTPGFSPEKSMNMVSVPEETHRAPLPKLRRSVETNGASELRPPSPISHFSFLIFHFSFFISHFSFLIFSKRTGKLAAFHPLSTPNFASGNAPQRVVETQVGRTDSYFFATTRPRNRQRPSEANIVTLPSPRGII